jgi:hypothetical protein
MPSVRVLINYRTSPKTAKWLENSANRSGISADLVAKRLTILSIHDMDSRYYNLVSKMTESKISVSGLHTVVSSADYFENCCQQITSAAEMFKELGYKVNNEDQRCGLIVSIIRAACKNYGDDIKDFELQFMGISESQDQLIKIAEANYPAKREHP